MRINPCAEKVGAPGLKLRPVQQGVVSGRLPKQGCRDPSTIFEMQLVAQQSQEHAVRIWLIWVPLEARPLEPLREIRLTIGRVDLDRRLGERQAKQRQTLLKIGQA